jgi:hypothetical protein
VWEHGDVLEQVPVGVTKVDGRCGHPRENHRLVRWCAVEVERGDPGVPQLGWRGQNIIPTHPESGMQRDGLRRGSGRPESKHRPAGGPNPQERRLTPAGDMRQRQADDVAIEAYRLVQVSDGKVDFEQVSSFNHQTASASPHQTSRTLETFHWMVPISE